MPEVGIERFRPREGQHDRAERYEHVPALGTQERHGIQRIERSQDGGLPGDFDDAGDCEHHEPHGDDGAEQLAHDTGAEALNRKQADEDGDGDGQHIRLERGRGHFQPLDRAQDRNRRRDDAVAVEKRCPEHAYGQQDHVPPAGGAGGFGRERRQGHDAAFAAIVGAQNEQYVLQRHHHHQTPEDDGNSADEMLGVQRDADFRAEHGLDGVQRAGPDVAIHDPQGTHCQGRAGFATR